MLILPLTLLIFLQTHHIQCPYFMLISFTLFLKLETKNYSIACKHFKLMLGNHMTNKLQYGHFRTLMGETTYSMGMHHQFKATK